MPMYTDKSAWDKQIEEADTVVHPVEKQWHYKYMIKYGYAPIDKVGVGFVRTYRYTHPNGHIITCRTGINADYWIDNVTKKQGYWQELEPYLIMLADSNLK